MREYKRYPQKKKREYKRYSHSTFSVIKFLITNLNMVTNSITKVCEHIMIKWLVGLHLVWIL